jgi:DNA-directed RNA polymerase subunit M/transcription elongation factor TFIIS
MQLCPDCIKELKPQSKKMGEYRRWMVCPDCGHRERPISEASEMRERNNFRDRIKARNLNRNQFNSEI